MGDKDLKILIAGGSIAGLTLANILERLGVDFLVLEAYPEIAPQVGASIGILPNGLRILDQLGLYPAIRSLIDEPIKSGVVRGPDGKELSTSEDMDQYFRNRHGYDGIFVDRQMVLRALFDHLKGKDKVLANKRVEKVSLQGSGVTVITKDGTSYQGDLLVGADGIHSNVRNEMWRIADQVSPGYIPASERTAMSCDYICMFGISVMKDFMHRETYSIFNKHTSMLILSGPSSRVYWFLFVKLDKTYYSADIPRYTKKDEQEFAAKYASFNVKEDATFADLYNARVSSVLTPLPEYVFKRWHFGRIITIGDAVHKFNPISGQGGNSAIETAAILANNLTRVMKSQPEGLSDEHVQTIFSETQTQRELRVLQLVKASHMHQALEAMETPFLEAVAKYYIPTLSTDQKLAQWAINIEGGQCLDMLDVPKRFRFVPFLDQLPSKPLKRSVTLKLVIAATFGLLFRIAQQALQINPDGWTSNFMDHPLKETYTGILAVDFILSQLVWCFSKGVSGDEPNQRLQCLYFMIMLIPVTLIWTVEGYRNGNHKSLVSLPVVFSATSQLFGIGKVAPIYYLISIYTSGNALYTRTTGRPIHSSVAKALLPALCIGQVIPTVLMFLHYDNSFTHQNIVALWQPCPIYVAILTFSISALIYYLSPTKPLELEMFERKDIAPLQTAYAFTFFLTIITHICSLFYIFTSSSLSIAEAFFNLPAPSVPISDGAISVFAFFKWDMVLCYAAVFIWCLYSIYELRRVGYRTTEQAVKAAVVTAVAQVIVGPGAAYTGVFAWREAVIAGQVQEAA
ncbi:FAD binding domain-containing protein [Macrophomina phaseolina]|uniref:FAD binding domain-containing protein n=1 Tax=Macrophomina phaseolina TaxID=35725 RepID=A0ABQ8FQK1_9PEZI|nr:FAD binding domain-containing protein [Macrophomina phaseolina]